MIEFIREHRLVSAGVILFICIAVGLSIYGARSTHILNKSEFSSFAKDLKTAAEDGTFTDQNALSGYITSWADEKGLEYTVDKAGNIIFNDEAVDRKKNVSPTVICVSYNYETIDDNVSLLTSAAMIAATDLDAGRKTVVFVNDEQNTGSGYRQLSKKLFQSNAKVIYMDYGSSAYMSNSSFAKEKSYITVKAGRFEPSCDSAVKVHISGLDSGVIGTGITKHPDPVSALSTLLARLKSKSAIYQLADFEVGTNGDMYPVSMDATIMLNSYAVPSFTKYIDKRIKAWNKAYGSDYEELSYTYELIEDPEQMPEEAYSRKATEKLTNVLYTLKSGVYQYEADDSIPEGRAEGDIYGINAVTGVRAADGAIVVDIMTQAYDDEYMHKIMDDNRAAAELFDCRFKEGSSVPRFLNEKDSLSRTFRSTFYKVNGTTNASTVLSTQTDNYFTPCSYLAAKNENADVIHLRLNSDMSYIMTNSILCYVAYKGNILF